MLKFNNSQVIPSKGREGIIQLYCHGRESGLPATGDINSLQMLRDQIDKVIDQLKMREIEKITGVVIDFEDFKRHG